MDEKIDRGPGSEMLAQTMLDEILAALPVGVIQFDLEAKKWFGGM